MSSSLAQAQAGRQRPRRGLPGEDLKRSALALYGEALRDRGAAPVRVRLADGTVLPLALERYLGAADASERVLLAESAGPVLDVGCGPGRHLRELAALGTFALGVDLCPEAVALARGGGARAILGDVFSELPGAGSWQTALLLDGNIGIGGAPARLLGRIGALLAPGGCVLAEVGAPGEPSGPTRARLERGGVVSAWFAWARVAASELAPLADEAGFDVRCLVGRGSRWFARLALAAC